MKKFVAAAVMAAILAVLSFGCASTQPVAKAYGDRARAKFVAGQDFGAINDLTKAIEINPKDAYLYVSRGLVHWKVGAKELAKSDFNKAISLDRGLEKMLKPFLNPAPSAK